MASRYDAEAEEMAQCVMRGYTKKEIAEKFMVCNATIERRLKSIGYTYQELVAIRKRRLKGKS